MDGKLMKTFLQLDKTVSNCQEDLTRFIHGNKSAGTRLRKAMQQVKQLAQHVRVEIQEQKNSVTV
tara:strand:+ start:312 stop:506 length:195 start_codon:yes stop_codon:yes gene_type:complete